MEGWKRTGVWADERNAVARSEVLVAEKEESGGTDSGFVSGNEE